MTSRSLPPLRIAAVQGLSHPADLPAAVAEHLRWAVEAADAGARVVVYPELSLSGYEPELIDLHRIRIEPTDPGLQPLRAVAKERGLHLLVGAPTTADGGSGGLLPEIAVLHIDPSGTVRKAYAKQYLSLGEIGLFSAASAAVAPATVEIDGWRLALALGRDAAVPEHLAAAVAGGADGYLVGALFLIGAEDRIAEEMSTVTRAGIWAVLAQYSGGTGGGPSCGGSGIWRPDGSEAGRLALDPGVVVADLR